MTRLAVYGFVAENAGSLAGANHLVLERLLALGHRIDFYAIDGFVTADGLRDKPGFEYIPVRHPVAAGWPWVLRRGRAITTAFAQVSNRLHFGSIRRQMLARHAVERYDTFLALGLLAPFRLPGAKTVSWTQGTPNGEYQAILSSAGRITRSNPLLVPALTAVYGYKYLEAFADHRHSDAVICGSRWAMDSWRRFGVPARKLSALPYPFDLGWLTRVGPPPAGEFRFLHLGRIVPRKRIDLLLDGFALVDDPSARLDVVGALGYGSGDDRRRLAAAGPRVTYTPAVPRAEVPGLIERASAIVQPSQNENFGSAVAEGLAAGRLAVLGPTNGTKDYAGPASVVFGEYSAESVATGLREAMRRAKAGAAAECRAAARVFAVEAVVDRLVERLG